MSEIADLLAKETLTGAERQRLRDRFTVLEAQLSNMRALLNKTVTGTDSDMVDGYHAGTEPGQLCIRDDTPKYWLTGTLVADRAFDVEAADLAELRMVVGTLISDLQDKHIVGTFV